MNLPFSLHNLCFSVEKLSFLKVSLNNLIYLEFTRAVHRRAQRKKGVVYTSCMNRDHGAQQARKMPQILESHGNSDELIFYDIKARGYTCHATTV